MSTVAGITVAVENIGNQLLYVYKCINNIFYFLEKHLKQYLVQSGMVIIIWREK